MTEHKSLKKNLESKEAAHKEKRPDNGCLAVKLGLLRLRLAKRRASYTILRNEYAPITLF